MNKKTILSGIQPSGNLCIANYLGALKNWKELQKTSITIRPTLANLDLFPSFVEEIQTLRLRIHGTLQTRPSASLETKEKIYRNINWKDMKTTMYFIQYVRPK